MGVVGGNILNGEHLDHLVRALSGSGSGGSKVKGGGLIIAATVFFHEHVICLQRIIMRQVSTKKKRSEKAIPYATNGDDLSRICPPPRQGERVSGEGIPHAVATRDNRRGQQTCAPMRNVLRRSDASDYFYDNL